MADLPRLLTERLLLRPFTVDDGPRVEQLAGAREVADTTLSLPHPYPVGGGVQWIATHAAAWQGRERCTLAVSLLSAPNDVLGAIALDLSTVHARGELGYWIGKEFWNRGYATEASSALIEFAFHDLGLHRVQARHFLRNPSSGRVMQKVGMHLEGVLRDAYVRWGRFEDVAMYAILNPDTNGSLTRAAVEQSLK